MNNYSIAIIIYGETNSNRNAHTEEKYKGLVAAFTEKLARELLSYDGILVWVNPIEQGNNRNKLDALLRELAIKGCFVSAHPDVILKIGTTGFKNNSIGITHATGDQEERKLTVNDFFGEMKIYFSNSGMLIGQKWNQGITNGMVRCYLTGTEVSGFGYQEINAIYPTAGTSRKTPSKRFYFTEACGLFQDLRKIMETESVSYT